MDKVDQALDTLKKDHVDIGSSTLTGVQIDLEDDETIQALAARIEKDYGRLDVLVNNAGMLFWYRYL